MSEDSSNQQSLDPRFSGIYDDPKFKNARRKKIKIKLDDRFSKSDLEVKKKSKVDKYGRKLDSTTESKELQDFDKFFEKEDAEDPQGNSDSEEEEKVVISSVDRARGDIPANCVNSSDEFTSSDSEESEDSDIESEGESDIEIETTKPESGDASRTLAVVNLDWDHVKSSDLMITFSSFLPKDGKIEKISVFPSEFGKERMQREEVEGPPREIFQKKKSKKSSTKVHDDESDSDVDIRDLYEEGDADKDVDTKALRQYQLERLRYFYAVVYCNNIATAEAIYTNCDGTEYESTANMFDLRYVPDGMEFDDEARDECTELPKNYKPLQFSTDALQHSNVKLTWDETPADRVEISKRAFSQKEIEDMDFKAYLASDSDGSEDEANQSTKNKLKSLVGMSMKIGEKSIMNEDDEANDEDIDMEITFTPGLVEGNDVPEKDKEESTIEKVRRKEQERRKARKQRLKDLKQQSQQEKKDKFKPAKGKKNAENETDNAEAVKAKAQLELLMMEDEDPNSSVNNKAHFNMNEIMRSEKEKTKKSRYQNTKKIVIDEFKPNLNDSRFAEVFEDHAFAIDPTQSEYKETKAMKEIIKERSKRSNNSKTQNKKRKNPDSKDECNQHSSISNMVKKLKSKSKNTKH